MKSDEIVRAIQARAMNDAGRAAMRLHTAGGLYVAMVEQALFCKEVVAQDANVDYKLLAAEAIKAADVFMATMDKAV